MQSGVYHGLSREQYDGIANLNWSSLRWMQRSPAHFNAYIQQPPKQTDAMRIGWLTHMAVLEPQRFAKECAIYTGGRRAGKDYELWKAKHAGMAIVKPEEAARIAAIAASVRDHPDAAKLLRHGQGEATVVWEHPIGTFKAKGRLDYLTESTIVDLKICRTAAPVLFAVQAARLGSLEQAAYYVDGNEAAAGKRLPYFIVAVEGDWPHVVQVFEVPNDTLIEARDKYHELLYQLDRCVSRGTWPGYSEGVQTLQPPAWWIAPLESESMEDLDLVDGEATGDADATDAG